jgi:peroxiredoxin
MGLAIASLSLGILAVGMSFLLVGILLGLIGVGLGVIHLSRKRGPPGMAKWGIVLSIIGIAAGIGFAVLYVSFFQRMRTAMGSAGMSQGTDYARWQGVTAPDFSVTTLDGRTMRLSDLKGKRVVVDLWATWCGPCVGEMPHFVQLYNQTSRDKVVILGISDEDPGVLREFIKKKSIPYPIASATNLPPPFANPAAIPTTFFIDSHGVIQSVEVGARDYSALQTSALAADFVGTPKSAPTLPILLTNSTTLLRDIPLWTNAISGAEAICAGAWDDQGTARILVAAGTTLHVLDAGGAEKSSIPVPDRFDNIECGWRNGKGALLLGRGRLGQKMMVIDKMGKKLWEYGAMFGIDGAHWGDLHGDGTDQVIAGMNGFGGLIALSSEGKELWSVALGNVWNQAVVPATKDRPALVFATEAGGAVRVFDATGKQLRSLKPDGGYYAQMTARAVDNNSVQILAINGSSTVAFDDMGNVAWTTSATPNAGGWVSGCFAAGDLKGDGGIEWVFVDGSGALVIATPSGQKLAALTTPTPVEAFTVARRSGQSGLLVTLDHGLIQGYEFRP